MKKQKLNKTGHKRLTTSFRGMLLSSLVIFPTCCMTAKEVTIRIAATSDVHGCLFPYDFEADTPGKGSLEGVYHLVDSIRQIPRNNLVLLENGDLVQGTPVAYYANFIHRRRTNLFARMLNFMQYDAATVGNHDIEAGPAVYNHLIRTFRFPYLGGNVTDERTGQPWFRPYTIVEREGIRIAVIGLTTPAVPRWLPKQLWKGLSFGEMTQSAAWWVQKVRETEHPDLVTGLFHTGFGSDREDENSMMENAGKNIAENVPGFDIIILGHDHRPRNEKVTCKQGNEVLVVNPGSAARNLAFAEIVLKKDEKGKVNISSVRGSLLPVPENPYLSKFTRHFRKDREKIANYASKPVGEIENPMNPADALFGNSALTDLIHRVQMEATGAEISFAAPLAVSGTIEAGTLYIRDLFRIYRYENFLYTMQLTGKEIKNYLEYSYGLWFSRMQSKTGHLLLFREGETARPSLLHPSYNFDSAAGIRYTVDVSRPAGQRITVTGLENGKPFSESETYRVALNSYRGSGGGGHLTQGAGIDPEKLQQRTISSSLKDFRSLLMDYIDSKKVISSLPGNNWQVVPVEYYEAGSERDRPFFR